MQLQLKERQADKSISQCRIQNNKQAQMNNQAKLGWARNMVQTKHKNKQGLTIRRNVTVYFALNKDTREL